MAVDHDQRFKVLLKEFFREFFELFFPEWTEYFDFAAVEWLDKEVFTDPPAGSRRFLDMVAKIKLKKPLPGQRDEEGEHWLALIHVEIEHEDTVQPLRPRMYQYYEQLRRQYRLPVLPIGLYLGVGLSGIGIDVYEEHFGPLRVLQFQYLCVGLPALDARKYAAGDNWLGVALSALMRCPPDERAQLTLESLQRLETCPENAWRRHLLGECVCAYSPLTDAQREEVADQFRAITKDPESPMTKSLLDTLQERGRQEGVRHSLRIVLEEKFGPLSPEVIERLSGMSQEEIEQTLRAFIRAKSLQELGLENGAGAQA